MAVSAGVTARALSPARCSTAPARPIARSTEAFDLVPALRAPRRRGDAHRQGRGRRGRRLRGRSAGRAGGRRAPDDDVALRPVPSGSGCDRRTVGIRAARARGARTAASHVQRAREGDEVAELGPANRYPPGRRRPTVAIRRQPVAAPARRPRVRASRRRRPEQPRPRSGGGKPRPPTRPSVGRCRRHRAAAATGPRPGGGRRETAEAVVERASAGTSTVSARNDRSGAELEARDRHRQAVQLGP